VGGRQIVRDGGGIGELHEANREVGGTQERAFGGGEAFVMKRPIRERVVDAEERAAGGRGEQGADGVEVLGVDEGEVGAGDGTVRGKVERAGDGERALGPAVGAENGGLDVAGNDVG